ncbi:hypothetical protein PTTG_29552, partial [Puccinia triticina 1-1 BBBD Race 1]
GTTPSSSSSCPTLMPRTLGARSWLATPRRARTRTPARASPRARYILLPPVSRAHFLRVSDASPPPCPQYTNCPIHANLASTYVYHFQTLASDFNYLTFNVTNDFFGPSVFCAGTPINFQQQP